MTIIFTEGYNRSGMTQIIRRLNRHFTVPYLTKARMKRVAQFWELIEADYEIANNFTRVRELESE